MIAQSHCRFGDSSTPLLQKTFFFVIALKVFGPCDAITLGNPSMAGVITEGGEIRDLPLAWPSVYIHGR